MITTYRRRSGPPSCIVLPGSILTVFICFLLWNGTLTWLDDVIDPFAAQTQSAVMATQSAVPTRPAFLSAPTRTPVPACLTFYVFADQGTIRDCPDFSCERRDVRVYDQEVCVYGRAVPSDDYPTANEWYTIDVNPQGAFRDLAYMHFSVLKPRNPTPRPSQTFTPLPTVTLTPSPSRTPIQPTFTPTEGQPPTETPLPTYTPTVVRPNF